ncbi:MAG: UDP-N-acetylglucosamine 1-carboxyvinyltransferase [Candidatus Marinimicrobia bacterium]|nr:UDP-N-acetylglucosamine 1-carboxyvinyltransferase [Candidatus Neomarinimicrobiota bacterium]
MDKLVINGGKTLAGRVVVSGAKNAVLPIMAAALLVDGNLKIKRVPHLRDTATMIKLLNIVGATTSLEGDVLEIDASTVNKPEAPYELVKTMRASFYVLGPLVSRFGFARVSLPGGCAWGPRPVDFHLKGLEKLGAKITLEGGYIIAEAKRLRGNRIPFEIPSVGATGNMVMAAVLADGITIIENAAREPEIAQLCEFLNLMGGKISGIGSAELTIEGVNNLQPVSITVIPDRIEAGTFLIAGAMVGEITVGDTHPAHLTTVLDKLKQTGAEINIDGNDIAIKKPERIKAVDVTTTVYPGFPTDLQAQWIAMMSLAEGTAVVTDTIYRDRFAHIPELNRMGANIKLKKNVALVYGQDNLKGAPVMSTDIRASASLILAGLAANGRTDISRVYHIDRGYEKIENKFRSIGADITRKTEE